MTMVWQGRKQDKVQKTQGQQIRGRERKKKEEKINGDNNTTRRHPASLCGPNDHTVEDGGPHECRYDPKAPDPEEHPNTIAKMPQEREGHDNTDTALTSHGAEQMPTGPRLQPDPRGPVTTTDPTVNGTGTHPTASHTKDPHTTATRSSQ